VCPLSINYEVPVVAENVFTPLFKVIFMTNIITRIGFIVEIFNIIFFMNVHVFQLNALKTRLKLYYSVNNHKHEA